MVASAKPESQLMIRTWQHADELLYLLTYLQRVIPANDTTRVASSLVHILGIEDVRYDIRCFGGKLMPDIVPQIGSDATLDVCTSAMVAIYNVRQYNHSKVDALTKYGDALRCTRKALQDPAQPVYTKMQIASIIFVCGSWFDKRQAEPHRLVISHLFRDAVLRGKLDEIHPHHVHGLCQMAVYASLLNPQFRLGQWFWDACGTISSPRPVRYHQGSFLCLDAATLAEIAHYLGDPVKYLPRLRWAYELVQSEKPQVRTLVDSSAVSLVGGNQTVLAGRVNHAYRFAYAIMLALASILNHIIRKVARDTSLAPESHEIVDESIWLAQQCAVYRPLGAGFVPEYLKMVWASIDDYYRRREIEAILIDFQHDVERAAYLEEALVTKRRLRQAVQVTSTNPSQRLTDDGCTEDIAHHQLEEPACVIL
ncbi:hypothetical protein E8E14_012166 [Neopestalotiopsis sp. 37M]|nr:hypothetical protein E8E14_012166 [Neopestalotiopsis sp. 37M]